MAEDSRKLFVAGLPDTVNEDVLKQLFEATGGRVVEVSLPKDRATGRPRGFGFVTLDTQEQAQTALEALNGSFQGGKSISVRPFQAEAPKREAGGPTSARGPISAGGGMGAGPPAPDRTLYVGNLPYDTSVEEVEAMITGTGAGPVVRVHLPADPDGRKRGFGFVTMASADSAKSAIELLRNMDVRGRRLVVNLAHPKGERPEGGPRPGGGYAGPGGGGGGFGGPPSDRTFGGPPSTGAPNRFAGSPAAPPRKTFDKRRNHDGDGGGRGRRTKDEWDGGRNDDWDKD